MYSSVNALAFTSVQPVTLEESTLESILSTLPLVHCAHRESTLELILFYCLLVSFFVSICFFSCVFFFVFSYIEF